MIKHNELAARLNTRLYKDTTMNAEEDRLSVIEETVPIECNIEHTDNIIDQPTTGFNRVLLIDYIKFIFNVLAFGYAAQFLLNANWPVFGTIAIGYTINFIFNKILFLFSL